MGKKGKEPTPPPEPAEPEGGRKWSDDIEALIAEVMNRFGDVERRDGRMADEPALIAGPSNVHDVASFLKTNEILPLNFCRAVTGIDKVDRFEVVYNLAHLSMPDTAGEFERVALVVAISDREDPSTPTLMDLWPGVDFQEREVFDLVGIKFDNHPDLRRILLDEEFIGHPLRKDYPLMGRWEDMQAIEAYLDEKQIRAMKEEAGLEFDPEKDVPPSYKR